MILNISVLKVLEIMNNDPKFSAEIARFENETTWTATLSLPTPSSFAKTSYYEQRNSFSHMVYSNLAINFKHRVLKTYKTKTPNQKGIQLKSKFSLTVG